MIKGANDILGAIEKFFTARSDLLQKIEQRKTLLMLGVHAHGIYEWNTNPNSTVDLLRHEDSILATMEAELNSLDRHQLGRMYLWGLEVQASCTGMYRLLRLVL
ncbi:hypothetical protein BX616_006107 [Lobosporangium transversale]|nr:hypothetical protein BX616_006107 [Lobosporangium transversale]